MTPLTLYSFGYWGWGNSVPQLVAAMDAVEASRGRAPPLFVDVRISRSVRAKGFDGNAFASVVGDTRYRWMAALGNRAIREGGAMRLADPLAVHALLDIAVAEVRSRRSVVFFCACALPCRCHRAEVARRALAAADERGMALDVVEWPGGESRDEIAIALPAEDVDRLRKGGKAIPLKPPAALADVAAIPWYTLARVHAAGTEATPTWRVVTGPARFGKRGWFLPVLDVLDGEPPDAMLARVRAAREADGYAVLATRR